MWLNFCALFWNLTICVSQASIPICFQLSREYQVLRKGSTRKTVENGILRHIAAFYSIKWHPMMTASIEHKHKCALVPYLHYLARAAGFEQVSPIIMVKNVIFTGFYGILRHFLVKFPTEFFVFSMDACVYMYIAPLNRRLCCGIFSYLPQLKRGVARWRVKTHISNPAHLSTVNFMLFVFSCGHATL